MTLQLIVAHNRGVRRVLALAEQTAAVIENEAGSGTERDAAMIEALRVLAREGAGLLISDPGGELDWDEEE